MNKGLVRGNGENGIKIGNQFYKYEIKIKGLYGDYRVFGNYDKDLGQIVFDVFSRGKH
jgi:hypothetical protein